jgi:two-component system sensor histidine kinase RegB
MQNFVFHHSTDQAVRRQQLSTVVALRTFALCSQAALVISVHFGLKVSLPLHIFLVVLLGLLFLNLLTWMALRQQRTIGPYAVALHVLVDLCAFSVLLYYTGGVTNPFVSLYLPLLGLAAALLPWRQVAVLAGVSVALYGFLTVEYRPLQVHLHGHEDMINLHLWGMGVNFLVSVLILVGFVARLADSLRQREKDLAQAQARLVDEERLAALGNQAASIAHQLSTPVSTIAMLVTDWQDESATPPVPAEDLQVLSSQVQSIQTTLKHMRHQIESMDEQRTRPQVNDGRVWLEQCLAEWRNRNPAQEIRWLDPLPVQGTMPLAVEPSALALALNVLLDNAAQSQARLGVTQAIEFSLQRMPQAWTCRIADQGAGIASDVLPKLGREVITHGKNPKGHGMGVFLIVSLLDRQGVQLKFENRKPHGACVQLIIPSLES